MVRRLCQKACSDARGKLLERIALAAREVNRSVDQIIKIGEIFDRPFCGLPNNETAAAFLNQPSITRQLRVSMTDRVVVHLQLSRQLPDTWQLHPGRQLPRADQENDLLAQLISRRNFTLLVDADLHAGPCSRARKRNPRR